MLRRVNCALRISRQLVNRVVKKVFLQHDLSGAAVAQRLRQCIVNHTI